MNLKNSQLIIETTNICQARCVMCPREKFNQKPHIMETELFQKIIDDAEQYCLESLDLSGFGDIFIDALWIKKIKYVKEKIPGINVFVSSTGFSMNKEIWRDVCELIDVLKLSIHGFTPEIYNKVHGGKTEYFRSMQNIEGFLEYSKTKQSPYTIGLFNVVEENKHEQYDWLLYWFQKFDEVMIWHPHNWIDQRNYRTIDESKKVSCGRPINGPMYIHADGKVSPCCFDINKRLIVGDIKTESIKEIYEGEPYQKLRDAHLKNNFTDYICNACDQTNYNPEVLLYSSDKNRKVGQIISNKTDIRIGDNAAV